MKPFHNYRLDELIKERKLKIISDINSLSDDDVMSGQDEIIINNMYEKYKFFLVEINDEIIENRKISRVKVKRPNLFYDNDSYYEQPYWEIDGVEVTSQFPFDGDQILFKCLSSTISLSGHPDIELYDNYFCISARETLDTMNKEENKNLLFNKINRDKKDIEKFVGYCNSDAEIFNNQIKTLAKSELEKRKEKVDKFYNISKMLEIPIKKNNPKIIEEIKIERKVIPLIKNTNSNPEYSISDDIYKDILDMIKHQGSTFERTPEVYNSFYEEQLRDIMLGFLNGLFKGKANGECFRKHGKTDISIEYENRAAFVAECKVWAGQKVFQSALKQLQSYTTWRDNKLCLIFFSRNKNFFKVIDEIKFAMPNEENFVRFSEIDKNEFDLILNSVNDNQKLKIRIFIFDISL